MRERHQPCRPVDLAPGVVAVMLHRLSGVQAHPHRDADRGVGAQLALRLDRGPGRARRRREGGAEAVSDGGRTGTSALYVKVTGILGTGMRVAEGPSTRRDRDGVPLRASFRAGPGLRRSDRPYRVIYRMSVRR